MRTFAKFDITITEEDIIMEHFCGQVRILYNEWRSSSMKDFFITCTSKLHQTFRIK